MTFITFKNVSDLCSIEFYSIKFSFRDNLRIFYDQSSRSFFRPSFSADTGNDVSKEVAVVVTRESFLTLQRYGKLTLLAND